MFTYTIDTDAYEPFYKRGDILRIEEDKTLQNGDTILVKDIETEDHCLIKFIMGDEGSAYVPLFNDDSENVPRFDFHRMKTLGIVVSPV